MGESKSDIENAPGVVVILDFDGTLTPTPGQELVERLYNEEEDKSLTFYSQLTGYSFDGNEPFPNKRYDPIVASWVKKMKDASPEEKKIFAMTESAVNFLKQTLELAEKHPVKIYILSKNHASYIQAVCRSSIIPNANAPAAKAILGDITIIDRADVKKHRGKANCVEELVDIPKNCTVIVCDDSHTDCQLTVQAVKDKDEETNEEETVKVLGYNEEPGNFNWDEIYEKIKEGLGMPKPNNEKSVEESIDDSIESQRPFKV
jgi:hypothetical protein